MGGFPVKNRGSLPSATLDAIQDLATRMRALFLVEHSEDGTHLVVDRDLAFIPVGYMGDWPTATAPSGWKICDGAQLNRVTYKALFDAIGTTFGAGDGSTTFNLPDARGRFALAKAASGTGATIGATGGALDHDHTMGAHTHGAGTLAGPSHTHPAGSVSGSTASESSHTHTLSGSTATSSPLTSTPEETFQMVDKNGDGVTDSAPLYDHTHQVGSHSHGVGTLATSGGSSHSHGAGTLAVGTSGAGGTGAVTGSTGSASGTSGTNNPAYIVLGNRIIFTGVAA